MADDNERWIPASAALKDVISRFEIGLGIDKSDARQEASQAILERLATGSLYAVPRGFLSCYDGDERPWRHWFNLRRIEPDGQEADHPPSTEPCDHEYCIPHDFWRAFKAAGAAAKPDWISGYFYIDEFTDSDGTWSGIAREVMLERNGLPGTGVVADCKHPVQKSSPALPKNEGGRPAKYDWEAALAYLVAIANHPDGLHGALSGEAINVSSLARLVENWFEDQGNDRPSSSEIRKRTTKVVAEINAIALKKSFK